MKKVMIAILLLVPIIIVASVFIASEIISLTTYISVDEISLNYEFVGDVEGFDADNKTFTGLEASVTPTLATNKTVQWTIEEVARFDDYEGEIASVDKDGVVTAHAYGEFYVVATSEEGAKSARCLFRLASRQVESVAIDALGSLRVGESVLASAVFRPIDCAVTEAAWASSDESVLTVDGNGICRAVGTGTATLSCTSGGVTGTRIVTVGSGVSKYGAEFFVGSSTQSLALLGLSGATAVSGATVSGDVLQITGSSAVLTVGGETVTVKKCGENEIVINQNPLLGADSGYRVEVGGLSAVFTASYKDATRTDKPTVVWSFTGTDDSSIATLSASGVLTAKTAGRVTIVADSDGETDSMDVVCRKLISYFVLSNNQNADKRGIAQETVVATEKYDSTSSVVPNSMTISVISPVNAAASDFYYASDNEHAVFSDNVLTFSGGFEGLETVNVTVTAKHPKYSDMSVVRTYSFKLADAIAVADYAQFNASYAAERAICLVSNIVIYDCHHERITNDLYGNGYIISAETQPQNTDSEREQCLLNIVRSDVTIRNVTMRVYNNISNAVASSDLGGAVLLVNGWGNNYDISWKENILLQYCIFENAHYGVRPERCDITIDGCILRNTVSYATYVINYEEGDTDRHANLTINNCIYSNTLVPSVGSPCYSECDSKTTIKVTGFCDVYNWQPVSNIDLISVSGDELLDSIIKEYIRNRYMADEFIPYRKVVDGEQYVHLGLLASGVTAPVNTVWEIEDERFNHVVLKIAETIASNPCEGYAYTASEASIRPGDFYKENTELYAKLRGETTAA